MIKSGVKILSILFTLIILFQLTSCGNPNVEGEKNDNNKNGNIVEEETPNNEEDSEANKELQRLLPARENYKWVYSGFAEYGHEMRLKSITKTDDRIIYSIGGEVFDPSGGEAVRNFELEITYTIEKGSLIQLKREEAMLDSIFDRLTLIKTPLKQGNKWNQRVTDKDGNKYTLRSTIEDIREENEEKIYSVIYEDVNGDYFERRDIKEGVGVIKFERLYKAEGESYTIGYNLYENASGYNGALELNRYLPPLGERLTYFGLAEYAHSGVLRAVSRDDSTATYEFVGEYEDGSGLGGEFKVLYVFDYTDGSITEKIVSNTRNDEKRVNSIIPNLIVLKLPINVGNIWTQSVEIDGREYTVEGRIIGINYRNLTYYPPTPENAHNRPTVKVRYIIRDIEGYFNNTYIEEREFQIGRGMISFTNLMKGELPISGKDLEDTYRVNEAIKQHMFGYGLSSIE